MPTARDRRFHRPTGAVWLQETQELLQRRPLNANGGPAKGKSAVSSASPLGCRRPSRIVRDSSCACKTCREGAGGMVCRERCKLWVVMLANGGWARQFPRHEAAVTATRSARTGTPDCRAWPTPALPNDSQRGQQGSARNANALPLSRPQYLLQRSAPMLTSYSFIPICQLIVSAHLTLAYMRSQQH